MTPAAPGGSFRYPWHPGNPWFRRASAPPPRPSPTTAPATAAPPPTTTYPQRLGAGQPDSNPRIRKGLEASRPNPNRRNRPQWTQRTRRTQNRSSLRSMRSLWPFRGCPAPLAYLRPVFTLPSRRFPRHAPPGPNAPPPPRAFPPFACFRDPQFRPAQREIADSQWRIARSRLCPCHLVNCGFQVRPCACAVRQFWPLTARCLPLRTSSCTFTIRQNRQTAAVRMLFLRRIPTAGFAVPGILTAGVPTDGTAGACRARNRNVARLRDAALRPHVPGAP